MVKLVWKVFRVIGCVEALNAARNFNLYKTLTQIAYHGGQREHYSHIYDIVNNGDYRLEWAMRAIYEQDKLRIEEAVSTQGHLATYSDQYLGFKLIDIFERDYLLDLKNFLFRKNKTLYSILIARSSIQNIDESVTYQEDQS